MNPDDNRFAMMDFDRFERFDQKELESALMEGSRLAMRVIPATCTDCIYFTEDRPGCGYGSCRRHPPTVFGQDDPASLGGTAFTSHWPQVGTGTPGCGDGVRGRHPGLTRGTDPE